MNRRGFMLLLAGVAALIRLPRAGAEPVEVLPTPKVTSPGEDMSKYFTSPCSWYLKTDDEVPRVPVACRDYFACYDMAFSTPGDFTVVSVFERLGGGGILLVYSYEYSREAVEEWGIEALANESIEAVKWLQRQPMTIVQSRVHDFDEPGRMDSVAYTWPKLRVSLPIFGSRGI